MSEIRLEQAPRNLFVELMRSDTAVWTAPTADGRPTWLSSMIHIALEGRCFVVSVNQCTTANDYPVDYPGKGNEAWSKGGSCIVSPLGQVLAGPCWDKEETLIAEVDLDEIMGAQLGEVDSHLPKEGKLTWQYVADFDVCGHYSRDDIFEPSVY